MAERVGGEGMRKFHAPAAIFWVAFGLRVATIVVGHTYRIRASDGHFDFGFEAGRIAQSLVNGHGYGNPFNGVSGPTAWLPPVFPLLLALCFKLFGVYSRGSALAVMVLDSLFSALIAPAVYEIAARCFDAYGYARRQSSTSAPVALWSAWIWALYPGAMQYAVHWVWEMSLTACLFAWAVVMTLRLRRVGEDGTQRHRGSSGQWVPDEEANGGVFRRAGGARVSGRAVYGQWVALGALWGCLALSNASLVLFFGASLLWVMWPYARLAALRRHLGAVVMGAAVACLVFGLVLAPWVVRNQRVMHAFVPTRSNFGVEFWQSTRFDEHGPFPWGQSLPMSPHEAEFKRYASEGELLYSREKGELAKQNVRARPGLFLQYTLERVQFFWFCTPHPEEGHPVREYLRVLQYAATSLAGLLGLGLMLRCKVPGAGLFALAFLLLPSVYYALTVQPRFRHPLEPLITICAVFLFRSATVRASPQSLPSTRR